MKGKSFIYLSIMLIALVGCFNWGEDKSAESKNECDGKVEAVFDITPGVNWVPFPFDYFTVPDPISPVGLRLSIDECAPPMIRSVLNQNKYVTKALNRLHGFGTHARVLIPISGDLNPNNLPTPEETLDKDSPILVFPIAKGNKPGPLVPFFASINRTLKSIELKPLIRWPMQTTLVVVVRRNILDWSERELCPSEQFLYLIKKSPDPSHPLHDLLEPTRAAYQPILESIEKLGIKRNELAVAFWFTTQASTKILHEARRYEDAREQSAPPFPTDFTLDPSPYPELAFIGRGHFDSPNFRDSDGVFYLDPQTGKPSPILPDESLEFIFTMPNPDKSDFPPPYPVVIGVHGAGASKEAMLPIAAKLAHWGFAFFAIDMLEYGSRATCPSGMEWLCFFNLANPLKFRDNIRQSAMDVIWLAKMIKRMDDLDVIPYTSEGEFGDGEPDLDTSNMFVVGHSLGTITGALASAASTEVKSTVSTMPVAYLTQDIRQHWVVYLILDIINTFTDFDFPETLTILFDLVQMVLEEGDPANYVGQLSLSPEPDIDFLKDLLIIEAVGDTTVPNYVNIQYALSGDIPLVKPYVQLVDGLRVVDSPADGWGLFQYDTHDHDFIFGDSPYAPFARYQIGYFLRSRLTHDRAIIVNPFETD